MYKNLDKQLQEFLSANTLIARLVNSSDLRGLPGNKVDVLLDSELTFRAYITVPVLPLVQDAIEGVFYILPDDTLNYIDNGEWVTLTGIQGPDGTTFYPSVDADGWISWTNDGGKINPDPVNIMGPKGEDGKNANAKVLYTTERLSTVLLGNTPINLTFLPGAVADDISIPETEVYDAYGTLGVVAGFNDTTGEVIVKTVTISTDPKRMPEDQDEAEDLDWLTPDQGDFCYVRNDNGKLAEYFVKEVGPNGELTWEFSHYINDGNYVVDVNLHDGTLIPKNPDGSVTLPEFSDLMGVQEHTNTGYSDLTIDADGKVQLPRYLRGVKDYEGNLLPLDDDDVVTLPDVPAGFNSYVIKMDAKDLADEIDGTVTLDLDDLTSIEKDGATMTAAQFVADVTPSHDIVYIHGLEHDGEDEIVTQEIISWFLEADDDDAPTTIDVRVLAIPKAGNSENDKTVPAYGIDVTAGDEIKHLELITYDNFIYRAKQDVTLTGNWVTDQAYFEILQCEKEILYTHIETGKELLYGNQKIDYGGYPGLANAPIVSAYSLIPFTVDPDSTLISPAAGVFTIPGNTTVLVQLNLGIFNGNTGGTTPNADWGVYVCGEEHDPSKAIVNVDPVTTNTMILNASGSGIFHNKSSEPVNIGAYCTQIQSAGVSIRMFDTSSFTVVEIGKTIDPAKYMLKDYKEDNPVGSVISYMGNNVPEHYLACDGAIYNVGDYPEFEVFLVNEFGSVDHFGGNAANGTYAVPDLRGEFLRGTGENGHTDQGNGTVTGDHQDATVVMNFISEAGSGRPVIPYASVNLQGTNGDSVPAAYQGVVGMSYSASQSKTAQKWSYPFTVRPTNTSVNFCIKVEGAYKVFIQNLAHSVGGTFSFPTVKTTWVKVPLTATNGDDSLISGDVFRAPVDGYYSLSASSGWTDDPNGDIWMSWQKRADAMPGNSAAELNKFDLANNTGSGQYRETLSAVVYLEAGDPVTLQIYLKNVLSGGAPKFTITLLNGMNGKGDIAYTLMHPNLWPVGVEQDFGDNLYGLRTLIPTIQMTGGTNQGPDAVIVPGNNLARNIVSWGGSFTHANGNRWALPCSYTMGLAEIYRMRTGTADPYMLQFSDVNPDNGTIKDVDVWVTYTK